MFALLQKSLDQIIRREALEAAVMATKTLAKPDCPRLHNDLFGIVVNRLTEADAFAMQAALRARGIETDVVPEAQLPPLPTGKRAQAFHVTPTELRVQEIVATRDLVLPREVFAFAAGGFVTHARPMVRRDLEWVSKPVARGQTRQVVEVVTEMTIADVPEFRVEFYFSQPPYRFQWVLDADSVLRANGEIYRLRDKTRLQRLLGLVASLVPVDRTNRGILRAIAGETFVYPSVRAFEEETIWSFYRLLNP